MPPPETPDAVRAGPAQGGKRKRTDRVVSKSSEPSKLVLQQSSAVKSPAETRPVYPAFVYDLRRRLHIDTGDRGSIEKLAAEVERHIDTLDITSRYQNYGNEEMEQLGTNLWNQAVRMGRDAKDGDDDKAAAERTLLLHCRLLAFLILHSARWSGTETERSRIVGLLKISLKASRPCLGRPLELMFLLVGNKQSHLPTIVTRGR